MTQSSDIILTLTAALAQHVSGARFGVGLFLLTLSMTFTALGGLADAPAEGSLPRVLIIGDSISIGYTAETERSLAGVAQVFRPAQNCGSTEVGLRDLDKWLGDEKWDIIHFNFGLHDVKYGTDARASDHHNVSPEAYERNLEQIVTKLKKTGAKLVFATTTPIPENIPRWANGDAVTYNEIALRVMHRHGVKVNDLYTHALGSIAQWQILRNVHFTAAGSRELGMIVAATIKQLITETGGGETTPMGPAFSGNPTARIFISPTGEDDNAGTAEAPVKTFDGALAKVEALPPEWSSDAVVFVEPGDYELQSTIRIGPEHSGRNGKKLIFKANGNPGSAVLIGGQRLDPSKWQEFRAGIYFQDLGDVAGIQMIYEGRRKARKARLPNFRYLPDFPATDGDYFKAKKVGKGDPWLSPKTKDIGNDLLQAMQDDLAKGVKHYLVVFGHGRCDWHKWTYPISDIDPGQNRMVLSEQKPILHKHDDHSNRYYVEGGLRFLDAKGEFYFDELKRRLYYMPYADIRESEIVCSTVNSIVKVEGAENVVFDGLQFTCSGVLEYTDSSYTWSDPEAALAIESSRSISVLNCRFDSIGQSAINLRNSSENRIVGCAMSYLGQSGIKLEFADSNVIQDCLIHDIGLRRLYCEGVAVHSSRDNTIRHLEIYNSARYGITLRARVDKKTGVSQRPTTGNVLEYIKIHDVNQDSGDTAGLHMAMINYPVGPSYTNTCNQITIHRSIAQPDITDEWKPTGVYLDHPKAVMNQSLNNIEVTDYDPRYTGYDPKRFGGIYGPDPRTNVLERQIYQNRPHNNRSSTKFNCSWSPDFDKQHMEYEKIGLTAEFPAQYRRE